MCKDRIELVLIKPTTKICNKKQLKAIWLFLLQIISDFIHYAYRLIKFTCYGHYLKHSFCRLMIFKEFLMSKKLCLQKIMYKE